MIVQSVVGINTTITDFGARMTYYYDIYNTRNQLVATVAEATLDATSTSVDLIGKNYAGYGNVQNRNAVWMLENFANSSPPIAPLEGQFWWDTATGLMNVYDGSAWKVLSQVASSATAPTNPVAGTLWHNTTVDQLFFYDGAAWVLAGPSYSSAQGITGAIPATVWDTTPTSHTILKFMAAGSTMAIFTKDSSFTLNANSAITGFTTLATGLTLSSSISGIKINGYATLDSPTFTGVPAAPTAPAGTVSTQIATTAFVNAVNVAIKDGVTSSLDTLNKLAGAVNNDPNFWQSIGGVNSGLNATVGQLIANVDSRFTAVNLSIAGANASIQALNTAIGSNVSVINGNLALKANIASPTLTGVPKSPTAPAGTANTQIATTAFVEAVNVAVKGGVTSSLDTLNKLAAAINNDAAFSTTTSTTITNLSNSITAALALKAPLASPSLTGIPTAPTADQTANTTQLATTAYVRTAISNSIDYWGTSRKYVSTASPTSISGNNGDFWFQIAS